MEKNPQNDLVYPGERVDDLQNGLYVIQNPEKFCFGMDAVLLSGCRCIAEIRRDFLQTAEKSRPVRISDCRDSFLGSLFDDLLRLLSPLL